MSTVTTQAVRKAGFTRAALSAVFATLAVAGIYAGSFAAPAGWSAQARAADDACANVEVLFARGTNEAPGVGATGQAFVDALNARMPGKSIAVYPVNYPASLNFGEATEGIADASNKIQSIATSCPDTKIVLGGYSQGAAVAGYTTADSVPAGVDVPAGLGPLPSSVASHVSSVVLFGTPDPWFMNLVARDAPAINIGQAYAGKALQLCATGDPVCFPGGLDRSAHSSYKDNGMAVQAADYVASKLGAPAPSATVQQTAGQVGNDQPVAAPATDIEAPIGN
ncbi:cutinase family protein [Mycolicibacterium sp. P9-64]|uniref:cutinase family protein n=1 Tax=Mycolicibacterium sp. P9-64 TaxID=2024612 RepID=UPI0011F0543B|nr:cutinase family protein [Mycolicibacterium sp. P9-64]KAA0087116.1 cutinase family protein [Mycolicibacterium sp. P9-64]